MATLRDAWRTEFEWLRQGTMTVSGYSIRFSELARHAPILVPTKVVEIARMLERVRSEEKESKDTKRSRNSGGFSGFYSATMTHHGGTSGSRFYGDNSVYHSVLITIESYEAKSDFILLITAGEGAQTPIAGTPEQRVQVDQVPEIVPMQPVAPAQPEVRAAASEAQRAPPSPQAMITAPASTLPNQPARGGGRGGRGLPRGGGQARYYALPACIEAVAYDSVITGIVSVCHRDASVLFDPGSTYSYVSPYFASYLDVSQDSLSSLVYVSTHVGDSLVVYHVYRPCLIALSGFETKANLLLLNMVDFDIILGMDWLLPHYAILDCHAKIMTLAMPGFSLLEWSGTLEYNPSRVISFLKAQQMVEKGCDAYLAYVRDVSFDTPIVESVPIVRDFPDMFPTDFPGILPDRDIDFWH
ncbi:uncharacterized protein [Nicotiana tomentosiformis]|uniref:uncharacterized protein n=1 Tax=Nicotiana tomentosiformis TaxID=4098 RepID=UPI00388CD179